MKDLDRYNLVIFGVRKVIKTNMVNTCPKTGKRPFTIDLDRYNSLIYPWGWESHTNQYGQR